MLRRCKTSLGILENMLVREQRYDGQEALEMTWNDSGDEGDFDRDQNKVETESFELVSGDCM